jgi:transcriptional regulator with XRE-family HTH domain
MIIESFFENLNALMARDGIKNANELSRKTGIAQSTINSWTTRKTNIPNADHIELLANYFNVEPSYFFMKPGTQGKTEATDDYFKAYVDRVAEERMPHDLLDEYKRMASGRMIIKLVEGNWKRLDSIEGAPDWFRYISPIIGEQFSLDLEAKLKRILQELQKKKEQKSG